MSDFLEEKHFSSASELLSYLQLRNPHWLPYKETFVHWAFRGQYNSRWSLTPSAMRTAWIDNFKAMQRTRIEKIIDEFKNSNQGFNPFKVPTDPRWLTEMVLQVAAEKWAVEEFVSLANQVGHPLPEDKRWGTIGYEDFSLETFTKNLFLQECRFIPAEVEFSLAQHHGIPTRALDWTYSPFVAAFFAGEEAIKRINSGDINLVIWAVAYKELKHTDLRIITQRKHKISYLQAQAGLFIYDQNANNYFLENGTWRTFEEVIASSKKVFTTPILRKLTLPIFEVYELLRLLAAENITRAHIMPTFDNIIETLKLTRTLRAFKSGIQDDFE